MSDKPLPPTPKRIHDARLKGQVPHSRDAVALATLAAVLELVFAISDYGRDRFGTVVDTALRHVGQRSPRGAFGLVAEQALWAFGVLDGAILSTAVLAMWVATRGTVGFVYAPKALAEGIKRLNPASYFQNLFSPRTLAELGLSLLKFAIIATVIGLCLLKALPRLPLLAASAPLGALDTMVSLVRATVRAVFGALVIPVVVDVWLKRTMLAKSLRMGYDEVRREFKDMMGDPQIKSARRTLALQWAAEDTQSARPAANAIIANPQHFAVALRFSETDTPVPLVIGSGADGEALALLALARRDGVPVVRFPRLARALYALGTAGEPIPPDTYAAVAFVYHLIETLEDGPGLRDDLDLSMCDDDDTLLPDGFENPTDQRLEGWR